MTADPPVPVIALGGINPENRNQVEGFPVAVISAILDAEDPKAVAKALVSNPDSE